MLTTQELERLIVSFNTAAVAVEELIKATGEIVDTNRKLKAIIDTKLYLEIAKEDIVKNLNEQNILQKSLLYLLDSDKETVAEIMNKATKAKDLDVLKFWQKRFKDEQ